MISVKYINVNNLNLFSIYIKILTKNWHPDSLRVVLVKVRVYFLNVNERLQLVLENNIRSIFRADKRHYAVT